MLKTVSPELVMDICESITKYARQKLEHKSRMYSDSKDGLKNLRHCEEFGITAEMGILVRMSDKMQRVRAALLTAPTMPGQLGDSEHGIDNNDIPDLINYCALLYAIRVIRSGPSTPTDAQVASDPFGFKEGSILQGGTTANPFGTLRLAKP